MEHAIVDVKQLRHDPSAWHQCSHVLLFTQLFLQLFSSWRIFVPVSLSGSSLDRAHVTVLKHLQDKHTATVDALQFIRRAMNLLEPSASEVKVVDESTRLWHVQGLLEACVEHALMSWLSAESAFRCPLVQDLREKWDFVSAHPPIAASVTWARKNSGPGPEIYVASWNLSRDDHISVPHWVQESIMESMLQKVFEVLCHETHPKAILCLQGCQPELLQELDKMLQELHEKSNEKLQFGLCRRLNNHEAR